MKRVTIYIIIFVFLLIVAAFTFVYYRGKQSATGPKVDYPDGQLGIPVGWTPTPLVEQLYKTMNGVNINPLTKVQRDNAWIDLAKLSTRDMVTAVYKIFNQNYFKEGNGTLTQWIKDESVLGWVSTAKNAALERLASLNLL